MIASLFLLLLLFAGGLVEGETYDNVECPAARISFIVAETGLFGIGFGKEGEL